eukprot:scaffold20662_cov66-Phaeocystis_antarctica.AAC.5
MVYTPGRSVIREIDALHTIQRRALACVPAATSASPIMPDDSLFVAVAQVAVSSARSCILAAREQDSSVSVRQLKIQSTSTESTSTSDGMLRDGPAATDTVVRCFCPSSRRVCASSVAGLHLWRRTWGGSHAAKNAGSSKKFIAIGAGSDAARTPSARRSSS